jgi:hypothetical protein
MSLVVESGVRDREDGHAFTELPIARTSDFREDKLTLVGVRMDPGYRQAIRIFGLDGGFSAVMVRAFDLVNTFSPAERGRRRSSLRRSEKGVKAVRNEGLTRAIAGTRTTSS